MDIEGFQKLIEEMYLGKDAKRGLPKTFMWFTEEVGELSRALREDNREELKKEFADVLAWLFTLASVSGIMMEEPITKYTAGYPVCKQIPPACVQKGRKLIMTETQYNPVPPMMEGPFVYIKKKRAPVLGCGGTFHLLFLCSVLLFTLFVGSLLLHKAVGTGATAAEETPINEIVVEGSGVDKVIISIKGILSSESAECLLMEKPSIVEVVKQHLEHARKDAHVKAILLEIDSPGGGITASDIIYNNVIKFKTDTKKKVVVYMQDVAASGGYYIASAADAIVAHPTTITGSIGVIMPLINVAGLINRYGIVDNSITSGDMKGIGSPLKQMTPEETAILKSIIDEMYMQFVTVVSAGRNMDVEAVKKIADGRIYTGKQALEKGLIDQLGYLEDAIDVTKKMAGLTTASIVRYERPYGLADLLGIMSGILARKSTIKLDIPQFHEQDNTKPMYLWTGHSIGN